jgi:hypothetical protein
MTLRDPYPAYTTRQRQPSAPQRFAQFQYGANLSMRKPLGDRGGSSRCVAEPDVAELDGSVGQA